MFSSWITATSCRDICIDILSIHSTMIHSSYRGWLFSRRWSQPQSSPRGCSGWTTGGYQCPCWSATWTRSLWSSSPGSEAPERQSCCRRSPWLCLGAPSRPSWTFLQKRKGENRFIFNHRKLRNCQSEVDVYIASFFVFKEREYLYMHTETSLQRTYKAKWK